MSLQPVDSYSLPVITPQVQEASNERDAIYGVLNLKGPDFTEPFYARIPGAIYRFNATSQTWVLAGPAQSLQQEPEGEATSGAPSDEQLPGLAAPCDSLPRVDQFNLISWNVDFMRPATKLRLNTALAYLESLVLGVTSAGRDGNATSPPDRPPHPDSIGQQDTRTDVVPEPLGPDGISTSATMTPKPTIILIQELFYDSFATLLQHPFVQNHYCLTDISPQSWSDPDAHYGTVTMIPLSLLRNVTQVFRTAFPTTMFRDACYVDLIVDPEATSPSTLLQEPSASEPSEDTKGADAPSSAPTTTTTATSNPAPKIIRIANVHLESLRDASDRQRVRQLRIVSDHLPVDSASLEASDWPDERLLVHAGIVGGDLNPIGPLDAHIPAAFGLKDAWTQCWGEELGLPAEDERVKRGHTWGYQPRSRWTPQRLDKVLFRGGVQPTAMEVIAKGLSVSMPEALPRRGLSGEEPEDEIVLSDDTDDEEVNWASDHYGLLTAFVVT